MDLVPNIIGQNSCFFNGQMPLRKAEKTVQQVFFRPGFNSGKELDPIPVCAEKNIRRIGIWQWLEFPGKFEYIRKKFPIFFHSAQVLKFGDF